MWLSSEFPDGLLRSNPTKLLSFKSTLMCHPSMFSKDFQKEVSWTYITWPQCLANWTLVISSFNDNSQQTRSLWQSGEQSLQIKRTKSRFVLQNKLMRKSLCCWQSHVLHWDFFFPLYKKIVELASSRSYSIPSSCKLRSTWVLKYLHIRNTTTYILSTTYPFRPNASIISEKPSEIPSFLQLALDLSIPFPPFLWVRFTSVSESAV